MSEHSRTITALPPKILVFDSGVGGLSVLREIRTQLPYCEFHFLSDNAGFPYGTRTETDLIARVELVMQHCLEKLRPDIAVIACNSASTVVLPLLREKYALPFVGVVPAIKPAALLSKSHHIGILATPATISRAYTEQLITDFASHCQVTRVGSSELVYQAERKLRGLAIDNNLIRDILAPFFHDSSENRIDTIVLACTHFPLLLEELEAAAPYPINWIESGPAIARRVGSLLGRSVERPELISAGESTRAVHSSHRVWTTLDDGTLAHLQEFMRPLGQIEPGVLYI